MKTAEIKIDIKVHVNKGKGFTFFIDTNSNYEQLEAVVDVLMMDFQQILNELRPTEENRLKPKSGK
jgi:hypothetical protein